MRDTFWKALFLLAGAGLVVYLLVTLDFDQVVTQIAKLGLVGLLLIIMVYGIGFVLDTLSFHLMLPSAPLTLRWHWRVLRVRALGEAINSATPLGGFGGEPVKAVILNRRFRISYQEGIASLVLAKTTNLLALLAFLSIGYVFIARNDELPEAYQYVATIGLSALALGVVAFYLIQRQRWSSRLTECLSRTRWGRRVTPALVEIRSFDDRLRDFYKHRAARFYCALSLALGNWLVGTIELMVVFTLLQIPVSWSDVWIIEAAAQLVRAGTFFIPASLGAQEGTFVLVVSALTGNPTAGLACALIRRAREVIWIAIGFALGWSYLSTRSENGDSITGQCKD